jgi:GT2 family glycosyltransferase
VRRKRSLEGLELIARAAEAEVAADEIRQQATVDLSIAIVSFNTRRLLLECLASIANGIGPRHEVLVVDNASVDGSAGAVRRAFPTVKVIELDRNAGFAGANNLAIRRSSGRCVLLLNSDTVVLEDALDRLVHFLDAHPGCGVVAPRLLNSDLTDQGTARTFPTPAAALFGRRSFLSRAFPKNPWTRHYLLGREHEGVAPFQVDWVSGACLMVRRSAIDRAGLLDEGYFMHWEDADWCRRIKRAGYEVWCVPAARVVHHEGKSRAGWPARQVWVFHASAFRYYASHHLAGRLSVLRPLAAAALACRAAVIIAGRALFSNPLPRRRNFDTEET